MPAQPSHRTPRPFLLMHYLLIPNEDGFGPSALLSHLGRALLAADPAIHLTIWNHSRATFNRQLYRDAIATGRVIVEPVWNLLQLAKPAGLVSIPATLAQVGDYRAGSAAYPAGATAQHFDAVLEFGVPAAARWARAQQLPVLSLFDHSWSKTLLMLLEDAEQRGAAPAPAERRAWLDLVAALQEDEAHTEQLSLFPPFITPPLFADYWQNVIGVRPQALPAVLGGGEGWPLAAARSFLQLTEPGRCLLLLGGDTPAWDDALRRLVPRLLQAETAGTLDQHALNVVVYVPARLAGEAALQPLFAPTRRRVRPLPLVPGGTIQAILPAVDLLITRAGGGVVNDAIATRTPFLCVPEPGQSQVAAILEACLAAGLTQTITMEQLVEGDWAIERLAISGWLKEVQQKMATIPTAAETLLLRSLDSSP